MGKYNFLQSVAKRCRNVFDDQCDQLTVIFPNKRAGIYFARYLSQLYDKPIWSPKIYSFEEYVESRQSARLTDELHLNLLLYQCYKKLIPNAESFDAFMPWGEMILKDFNDVDSYLVEPEHMFRVIKSQKELDEAFYFLPERDQAIIQRFWKGFLPKPSPKQNEFIKTWSILNQLYVDFHEVLEANGLTYKGLMIRRYAEKVVQPTNPVWFIGFNALTGAEETIIKALLGHDESDIFWDIDDYYLEDDTQESGTFFRQYARDPAFAKSIERDRHGGLNNPEGQVTICSATMGTGQIMAATQVLAESLETGQSSDDTLIVVADESLLDGLLEHMPTGIEEINITMGWPVYKSRVYLLVKRLLAMKSKMEKEDFSAFTFDDVDSLMEFGHWLGNEQLSKSQFKKMAIDNHQRYFKPDEVIALLPTLQLLTTSGNSEFIEEITKLLAEMNDADLQEFEKATLVRLYHDLNRLIVHLNNKDVAMSFASLSKLIDKIGRGGRIPLSGDITSGVQVMGVLETRNLSFKHVMILGMNEDTWPASSSNASFIPFNIRKAFDLPTVEHQDAMQAYLFYRLVQSAENLWITYNNITQFNQNGELSRFVQQLQQESQLQITEVQATSKVMPSVIQPVHIEKDEKVLKKLSAYLGKKSARQLSPSAINTYLECRLRFYYQYVERLKEPDELIQDIDPALLGNLLHGTMEYLYEDGGVFDKEKIVESAAKLDEALRETFKSEHLPMSSDDQPIGRQAIAYEVVKRFAEQILAFDQKHDSFEIIDLEGEYNMPIAVGDDVAIVKGIIDRVDLRRETVRIMDYKSGRDDRKFKDVASLFDRDDSARNKAVFQLFYYAELYVRNKQPSNPVSIGLFNSKDLFSRDFDASVVKTAKPKAVVMDYNDFREEFVEGLEKLIAEIFDHQIPFDQTEEEKKCEYCPYQQVCMRV